MKAPPNVVYAQLKYMWARGGKEETLEHLRQFTNNLGKDIQREGDESSHRANVTKAKISDLTKLLALCYFKQGEWQMLLKEEWNSVSTHLNRLVPQRTTHLPRDFPQRNTQDILHAYFLSTVYDPVWCKAWHTWALANFEVIGHLDQLDGRSSDVLADSLAVHVVQAVDG